MGGTWNRRDANINGPVVVPTAIVDGAGNPSSFTNGSVPWFDPRVISHNGSTIMPMIYTFHDDNN